MSLQIETYVSTGWGQNAFLVRCAETGATVIIDPGGEAELMIDALGDGGLEAILLTHAHLDHVEGVATLKRATGAPIWLHPADRPLYDQAPGQAAAFGVEVEAPPPPDEAFEDGVPFRFGSRTFQVRHTPGHAPGHVLLHDAEAGVAFVGDVVFAGSIGRTDLPGGDYRQLMRSIRERVLTLPDETRLYPGHGPETTVEHERTTNPFLIPHHGGRLA